MTTIPELFKIISNDIQATFEELTKLMLRKSLRPTLNPYIQNVKVLYNPATGKYERGYVGASADDNVNKYNYNLTNECLGWVDDNITTFKVSARIIKSNFPARKPQLSGSYYSRLTKVKVAYNNREQKAGLILAKLANYKKYSSLIELLLARNMQNLISNKKAGACFVCDISYIDSFRDLESVGQDIINQTSPVIPAVVASQLSTSMLRAKLFNLDNHFALLSTSYPDIYTAYINMILAINSIQRTNMAYIINLVALLSYQSWNDFSSTDKALYLEALGEDFINEFNTNLLINALISSNNEDLIFTTSYLFSLLKMLFITFGFGELTPNIVSTLSSDNELLRKTKLSKHYDKYRGSSFRRGDNRDDMCVQEYTITSVQECTVNSVQDDVVSNQNVQEYINQFYTLYPNIINIMGGIVNLPQSSVVITASNIPSDFIGLTTIQDYLWRFSYYSYAAYINYIASKQMTNDLLTKVNNKKIELQNL